MTKQDFGAKQILRLLQRRLLVKAILSLDDYGHVEWENRQVPPERGTPKQWAE